MRPGGLEAQVTAAREDQVVRQRYPDERADPRQPLGRGDIFRTGLEIAAGMVMTSDDGRGAGDDSRFEYFPWVNEARGKRSNRDGLDGHRHATSVQVDNIEVLPVVRARTLGHEIERVLWPMNRLRLDPPRSIADHNDADFAHTRIYEVRDRKLQKG